MSDRHNSATVCLSVRVTPQEAEQLRELTRLHRITVQAVLRQCVRSSVDALLGEAERAAAVYVSTEDAARGGAPTHRLRVLAERETREA